MVVDRWIKIRYSTPDQNKILQTPHMLVDHRIKIRSSKHQTW